MSKEQQVIISEEAMRELADCCREIKLIKPNNTLNANWKRLLKHLDQEKQELFNKGLRYCEGNVSRLAYHLELGLELIGRWEVIEEEKPVEEEKVEEVAEQETSAIVSAKKKVRKKKMDKVKLLEKIKEKLASLGLVKIKNKKISTECDFNLVLENVIDICLGAS